MNILKKYADQLKPLNDSINDYNEFWYAQYFAYNPDAFRISSHGGGSYFRAWETDQDKKQDGYIPLLSVQTDETTGYTLIELNNKNAQKLYEEQPNVYNWFDYVMHRANQDRWQGFGWNEDKEYCHGINAETLAGRYGNTYAEGKSPNKLILCFRTGGGESADQQLSTVIRVKEPYDDFSYVAGFISDYCSPTITLSV
tara:strand:+ start:55 stop:648 length:594 start_codon:yes stop_codon:yes gene_type:complete